MAQPARLLDTSRFLLHGGTDFFFTGDRWFESVSLQRRVQCEPDFLDQGAEQFLWARQSHAFVKAVLWRASAALKRGFAFSRRQWQNGGAGDPSGVVGGASLRDRAARRAGATDPRWCR